jgi:hypothetical protein
MRTRVITRLVLGVGAMVALAAHAEAHGAVAVGGITKGSPYGSAYGISYSFATKTQAHARALKECETHRGKVGTSCKIVADFSRRWASIAIDPEGGTPGFGWALDPDKKTVEAYAMYKCKSTSPDDRKPFCKVALTSHDDGP